MTVNQTYEKVLRLINNKDIKTSKLSKLSGISSRQIDRIKSGHTTNIRESTANKIIDALESNLDLSDDKNRNKVIQGELNMSNIETRVVIENQQRLINSLDKELAQLKATKAKKSESLYDFKFEHIFITLNDTAPPKNHDEYTDAEAKSIAEGVDTTTKVYGNIDILGYTKEEIEAFSTIQFIQLQHESNFVDSKSHIEMLRNTANDYLELKGTRILKAKNGSYKTFECEFIWSRLKEYVEAWKLISFYKHLNGDSHD